MSRNIRPKTPAHGPAASSPFIEDETARSTVAFVVGGTTVTMGGLLAWFGVGTLFMSMDDPTFSLMGFFAVTGVVCVLAFIGYQKWGR